MALYCDVSGTISLDVFMKETGCPLPTTAEELDYFFPIAFVIE
jgi:hypothetical protein